MSIKKNIMILTLVFLVLLLISSNNYLLASEKGNNFLWKVSSGSNNVYIMGGIHFADKRLIPSYNKIKQVFDKSDYLVVQARTNNFNQTQIQRSLMLKGIYIDGTTLKDHISNQTYRKLNNSLSNYNLNPIQIYMMKPWLAALTLTSLQMEQENLLAKNRLDKYFIKKASNKKILELEPLPYLVKLLSNLDPKTQKLFLSSTLAQEGSIKNFMEQNLNFWEKGDFENLQQYFLNTRQEHPEFEKLYTQFWDKRNQAMASKIEGYLNSNKNYFILVETGHLLGAKGILNLLKNKNYKITEL
ncbi:TraB/GumN family protein [Orenia marismortui]|uniref:TraB/GumN family protein n=1 Tax=Orenia marismortui TaxID=46469 RepID=UPI000368955F|nr:TraB/GumN family protein [Orenia marismortui]